MNNNTTEIARIDTEQLTEIVNKAPGILKQNERSHDKALEYGKNLVEQAQESGMNDNLDELMSQFQGRVRLTLKTMNERRKPFTQITDHVKKFFTGLESDLNSQNKASIYVQIQEMRNDYATKKIEEQRRREREAQEKIKRENERIEIKKKAGIGLSELYGYHLLAAKNNLTDLFESFTLKDIMKGKEKINAFSDDFTEADFARLDVGVKSWVLPEDEINMIIASVKSEAIFKDMQADFKRGITALKRDLIDKLPSKKAELEEMEKANEEEKKRMQEEAEARRIAEQRKANEAAELRQREAEEKANVEAMGESMSSNVDAQADLFQEKPKVKEAYEIIVKNPAAYALIFQFWFDKEGSKLPVSKLEKYTISRMKKFCENYGLKHEEKIESKLIEYKEIFKAK